MTGAETCRLALVVAHEEQRHAEPRHAGQRWMVTMKRPVRIGEAGDEDAERRRNTLVVDDTAERRVERPAGVDPAGHQRVT